MKDIKWLNENSRLFLSRGYLKEGQSPEDRLKEISNKAENILGIDGFSNKFYDYLSKGYYSLSTPVWTNFGNNRGLPISCFGSNIEDDMADILYTSAEVGMMSKYGGGTSAYFGKLRERGAEITDNGESSGAVHFMKLFEQVTDTVNQGNSRRGRIAPYLPIDHPDIDEFLEIGTEGNEIQNLNHGVTVSDDWLLDMIGGDKDKRKTWAKVLQRRTEMGYPYIFFTDNVNNNKPDWYKDYPINHSNLCVSGDTLILTKNGYKEIKTLVNQEIEVWNGEEWSNSYVDKTGENQELLEVITNTGQKLKCTPYHKFYVLESTATGKRTKPPRYKEVRAGELQKGDQIIKFDLPIIEGKLELEHAYDNGFFSGDGCQTEKNSIIYLYNDKKDLISNFTSVSEFKEYTTSNRLVGFTKELKDKYFIPDAEYTINSRLKWLSGYLDADGCITNNNGSQSIQVSSTNYDFLTKLQLMLQTLGVYSRINLMHEERDACLPKNDGTGDYDYFHCKEIHRLIINGNGLYQLSKLGFKTYRLNWKENKPNRECYHFIKIEEVKELDKKEDTFCFNEPKRHMGMFNGILTGQCSEIALPNNERWSFVCNLSSMNLLHYDEWKDTDAVETMIYFLDAVMTDFIDKLERLREINKEAFHFMEKAYNFAKENRALGIGALGWHSLLQSKMIAFESEEASLLNEEIFKMIRKRAEKASEELAKKYGEPKVLKGTGRRNTTLMAVAPTTSSAFILGQVSQSIEPIWSNNYVKDVAKAKVTIHNPYLKEVLQKYGKDNRETWIDIRNHDGSVQHLDYLTDHEKEVFKTFSEINQYEIINQASIRQKYIDQGQSLNIMVNPKTSAKELNQLHLYAWEQGIKSLYYQHSTNAAQQFYQSSICLACEA